MSKKKYYVYVGQLRKEFALTKKAKRKNLNADPQKPCLYVGYSEKPPEERWSQHLNRARKKNGDPLFSRIAAKWGENYIHWKKFERFNPIESKAEAEKLEGLIAKYYRFKKFTVWSDKLPYVDKDE